MANYFFLAPSLPPLKIGEKPEITFEELKLRLDINLTKEDRKKAEVFFRFVDLNNIRSLMLEEQIDPRGNLDEKQLDEALLIHNVLPDYVFDFLDRYDSVFDRLHYFWGLLTAYFNEETPKQKGFLRDYLNFERGWRLVLAALRAKQLNRDMTQELQFEDFSDVIVAQILAQKDAKTYDPPVEYTELKEIMESTGRDPWQKYKAFTEWRFKKIEELVDAPLFSMDWILSYMAQLIIVEDWYAIDAQRGKIILETYTAGVR